MKVLIIEDEKPAARRLNRMLETHSVSVLEVLHSVEEAIVWFSNNPHPDLIFLDIQLSDGLSFEIFEAVTIQSAVIFTTAYDEYALQAFSLNSIDYLLKPIEEEALAQALAKYTTLREPQQSLHESMDEIRKMLTEPDAAKYKKRILTRVGAHIKMIPLQDVVCIYSEDKATYVHTSEKRRYLLDTSLEQLQTELDPSKFFRINRKYIIALEAIADITAYSNSRFKLTLQGFDSQDIIVARERVKDFKLWLE